jgi:hypothetical protein
MAFLPRVGAVPGYSANGHRGDLFTSEQKMRRPGAVPPSLIGGSDPARRFSIKKTGPSIREPTKLFLLFVVLVVRILGCHLIDEPRPCPFHLQDHREKAVRLAVRAQTLAARNVNASTTFK